MPLGEHRCRGMIGFLWRKITMLEVLCFIMHDLNHVSILYPSEKACIFSGKPAFNYSLLENAATEADGSKALSIFGQSPTLIATSEVEPLCFKPFCLSRETTCRSFKDITLFIIL